MTYELEQYPEDKVEPQLEKHVAPAIRKHMRDFLANIASRAKPVSDIEQGYISTSSCILANLAMKTGRTLAWDAEKQRIANDEDANRLLQRPYRQPGCILIRRASNTDFIRPNGAYASKVQRGPAALPRSKATYPVPEWVADWH